MAIHPQHRKRNHFPDWLFYLISAAFITVSALSINYYNKSQNLNNSLSKAADTLLIEKSKVKQLSDLYENQGKLVIKNTGSHEFNITDFYIVYYDTASHVIQTIRGTLNSTIDKGGTCSPAYWKGDKPVWDGQVLCYFLSIKGGDISGDGIRRYFVGNWEKDKKFLGISLDEEDDYSGRIYPKCTN
jgi:hypothetical protein